MRPSRQFTRLPWIWRLSYKTRTPAKKTIVIDTEASEQGFNADEPEALNAVRACKRPGTLPNPKEEEERVLQQQQE
jgi:hypothetical protein